MVFSFEKNRRQYVGIEDTLLDKVTLFYMWSSTRLRTVTTDVYRIYVIHYTTQFLLQSPSPDDTQIYMSLSVSN